MKDWQIVAGVIGLSVLSLFSPALAIGLVLGGIIVVLLRLD